MKWMFSIFAVEGEGGSIFFNIIGHTTSRALFECVDRPSGMADPTNGPCGGVLLSGGLCLATEVRISGASSGGIC
jgi:hypothetical protein